MSDERLDVLNNSTKMIQRSMQEAAIKKLEIRITSLEAKVRDLEGAAKIKQNKS